MLSEKESVTISKFLSLVLRHRPEAIGILLDENGWTDVAAFIEKVNGAGFTITPAILKHIVDTNPKKRFAFNSSLTKIRASQGHSVTVALGYEPQLPPDVLYHGTAVANIESIIASGLQKQSRTHVHLSAETATAITVGKRHGKPFVFEVLAGQMHNDGFLFFLSENGIWLTNHVPPNYLKPNNEQVTP